MQGLKYTVDIVVCIDATGSMSSIIERTKESAQRFYDDLDRAMKEKGKFIDKLRLKVIIFRDYYHDSLQMAMNESPFFVLPDEKAEYANYVKEIRADGGGDEPESGLEALALAIKSDWAQSGDKKRQVIVIWTDASAHELEKAEKAKPSGYPSSLPKNINEITDLWESQNQAAKRLIMYAPDAYPWTTLSVNWDNTIHFPSQAGMGLTEMDYNSIIDAVAQSV